MDKPTESLDAAIEFFGTQLALAEKLGIKSPSITEWRARGKVPVARCLEIELATSGAVTRYDLRPDVFGPAPEAKAVNRAA